MAITSGFFNSKNGDRKYNAEDMSNYFEGIVGNGVFQHIGNQFKVTAAGNEMAVYVDTGRALINSHWVKNDSILTLEVEPSDVKYDRIDRVVLCLDTSTSGRAIDIYVKKGKPAQSPFAPELTRSGDIYELSLARLTVLKNSTKVVRVLTDVPNSSVCGYVTGLIDSIDTSVLFDQFEKELTKQVDYCMQWISAAQSNFKKWFENLTESLHVDTTLKKYKNVITLAKDQDHVPIDIDEYERGDIFLVHVDGVFFNEGTDYEIRQTQRYIKFHKNLRAGTVVSFMCIKAEIGTDVIGATIDEINGEVI